jgi:hypothetical protein
MLAMDWSDRIGRRIKLRDLHILMAIADTGSMAKAAAKMGFPIPPSPRRYPKSRARSACDYWTADRRAPN